MITPIFTKQPTSMPASLSPETTPSLVSPHSTENSSSDCKKPRKNRSAYTLFALDIKPKIKAASNFKMSCVDLQTSISQLWKDLPHDERKKYQDLANEEKLHYMLKLKKFYENASPETLEEASKPKPKRPYSAYCYFVKEIRHIIKLPDTKFRMQEILKQASEKWRTLSEEEKAVYHEKARLAKENNSNEATDSSEMAEVTKIEEVIDSSEFAFEPQSLKKKSQEKGIKTHSTNKKRGLHFPKDIREKMEKLEKESPSKKVKTNFFEENQSNTSVFTSANKTKDTTFKFEAFLDRPPVFGEEGSKMEVKQETMEEQMLKPLQLQMQSNSFWPSTPLSQMIGLQMPGLNPNVNIIKELTLAMEYENVRRQLVSHLLMRNMGQMNVKQNATTILQNNIEVKAECL